MATLRIEIDVFSGRPNPVIELTGRDASALVDRLGKTRPLEKGEPGLPPVPTLGYRGMICVARRRGDARDPAELPAGA